MLSVEGPLMVCQVLSRSRHSFTHSFIHSFICSAELYVRYISLLRPGIHLMLLCIPIQAFKEKFEIQNKKRYTIKNQMVPNKR